MGERSVPVETSRWFAPLRESSTAVRYYYLVQERTQGGSTPPLHTILAIIVMVLAIRSDYAPIDRYNKDKDSAMANNPEEDADAPELEEEQGEEEFAENEGRKLRLEKEKNELLASLASGNFSTMKTKVAAMLNLYPHARNSDVALALMYWETFQPDVYNANGILPKDLFKLERLHYIVRARAKIQNEYGLFQADDKIRRHRKNREEEMYEAVLADTAPRRMVYMYADETGKNQDFVMVAAVWVLTGRSVFTVSRAIQIWQQNSPWAKREIHFAKFGKGDFEPLADYLKIVQDNREFLSFKFIAVEKARTRRSIEEVVLKLHEHMLARGAEHEVSSGRIDLPREIELTIDQEQSLDSFTLSEMKRRVAQDYVRTYYGKLMLCAVQTASSRDSPLVQLADLVAGAVNRRLNHRGDRNVKDEMADMIIDQLGLALEEDDLPDLDATALFRV